MSDTTQSYSLIYGKVIDPKGTPLSGVGITLILSSSSPQSGSSSTTQTLTSSSLSDGTFSYRIPTTDISPKNTKLTFTKENYRVKNLNRIQKTSIVKNDGNEEVLYEIPRITMRPGPALKEELQTKVDAELTAKSQQLLAEQINEGFQAKLASRINQKLENNKKILLPYVLDMMIKFGPTIAQQIVDKTFDPNNLPSNTTCPLPETLLDLINKRNNLVQQLNNSYEDILTLTKALNITDVIIKAIQIGLILYQTYPYPATGIPPNFPPLTAGQIALINISITVLQTLLAAADVNVDVLTVSLGTYGYFLALLLDYLSKLDTLIQFCASQPPTTPTTIGLTAEQIQELTVLSGVGETAIPSTALNFEQVNDQINALSNSTITLSQSSEGNIYKGFKLEIIVNEKNTSKFIQRYAQALTTQGVPVLKTEPSFASDPQVLIDQLKFIIDSNPNITAE